MPTAPRLRTTLGALAACAALAACRPSAGEMRASYVEQAVKLAPEIERATGLRFTTPPRVEVRTAEQVRAFLEREIDEPRARAELQGQAAAYRRLGMMPDTIDLRALLVRVLEEQVVGYYDPRSKTLYVVEGADSAAAAVTLRHELVHALQDQHRNLDSLLRLHGQADRASAAHAALEGQATWVQLSTGGDTSSRSAAGWERTREAIRANMNRTPVLAAAPLIVRETLLFPYLSGAELVRRVAGAGHPDSVLLRLPTSTEQVLHADRYAPGRADDAPLAVRLPAPTVGTLTAENTLGEFETRLVLFEHLQDLELAARASGGWGGDRWAIVRTPAGDAFVWLTAWDGGVDAAEFYDALAQVVPHLHPSARAETTKLPTARAYVTTDASRERRALLVRAAEVQGRPVVLYVDAPAAAGTDLLDLARVTLQP
ncbi:hypothetical protein [Roseisolibacter agri]|uniref:DUF4157 domain-containing protein n=1 Tax=Roseisolibacter agri TaxID=2014610 RepID=A0AA37QLJ3_9BACT|nr:hypothetical protein [Roseisolibacter agri]GLC28058.1 hypothetical protein rosag_45710 [Roseisolibacter agri]